MVSSWSIGHHGIPGYYFLPRYKLRCSRNVSSHHVYLVIFVTKTFHIKAMVWWIQKHATGWKGLLLFINIYVRKSNENSCYIAGNFFPTARALIDYFELPWHLTMKLFPAAKSISHRVTVHCYPRMLTEDCRLQRGLINSSNWQCFSHKCFMSIPHWKHTKGNGQNSGGREALKSRDKRTRREALLGGDKIEWYRG